MSKAVQRRFGTSSEHAGFTGISGEFTYNTDTGAMHTHDGVTVGGFECGGYKLSTNATKMAVATRLKQRCSVADFGGSVDESDNSSYIAAARDYAVTHKVPIHYGGVHAASGYSENLSPIIEEYIHGTEAAPITNSVSTKPMLQCKLHAGTVATFAGYGHYVQVWDTQTKASTDVQSGATGLFRMNSYSTNSAGADFNETNQVALVANASALSTTASASIEAFNAIAESLYTGALAHNVVGVEADLATAKAAGVFGDSTKCFSVGFSAQWIGAAQDGTVGYFCSTSDSVKTWQHSAILSGAKYTGLTITRVGTLRPKVGMWLASAEDYGMYIGGKPLYDMNPGCTGSYTYVPSVGIALGQTAATSGSSHKLRFVCTNGSSVEHSTDYARLDTGGVAAYVDGTVVQISTTDTGGTVIGGAGFVSGANNILLDVGSGSRAFSLAGTGTGQQIGFYNGNGAIGSISTNGSTTTYNTSSDYRLKYDIAPFTQGHLDKLDKLKPCTYKWKVDGAHGEGFIAHELQEYFPQAVTGAKDAVDANGSPMYQGIDVSVLVPTLVKAIQDLRARVSALEASAS